MRRAVLLVVALAGAPALAADLSPANRASAETLLSTLAADPFAEQPLQALERVFAQAGGNAALAAELERRAGAEPQRAAWPVLIGRLELARGHVPAGMRAFARAVELGPGPRLAAHLATALDQGGDAADAVRAYRLALAGTDPLEQRTMLLRMGNLLLSSGRRPDALQAWREAKQRAPRDQALRRQIAESLAAHGAVSEAVAELAELQPLVASDPVAAVAVLRRQAELTRRLGDHAGSLRLLVRAWLVAGRHDQPTQQAELAHELLGQASTAELIQLARSAAKDDPLAAALEGEALAATHDDAGAAAAFARTLKVAPRNAYVLRRLSSVQVGPPRVATLQALAELAPGDGAVALELQTALLAGHRDADAIAYGRGLRSRFADNATLLGDLAGLQGHAGQHAEAAATLERALTVEPKRPDLAVAYGDELRAMGRGPEAVQAYWRLAADRSLTSYRRLIDVLGRRALSAEVQRAFDEALRAAPDDLGLRRDHARWLQANKQPDAALAEWKRVRERAAQPFLREYADREIQQLERQRLLDR